MSKMKLQMRLRRDGKFRGRPAENIPESVPAEPIREAITKLFGAAAFLFLGGTSLVRIHLILEEQAHGIGAGTMVRLLTAACQAAFYAGYVWFTVARRAPRKRAAGVQPRVSALLGTFLPLGFGAFPPTPGLPVIWHAMAAVLLLLATALAAFFVLPQLGRSFSLMAEARQLVTGGPYRFIRHPLYVIEEIAAFGAFLEVMSLPALVLLVTQVSFQIRRIYNEERVLEDIFPEYAAYRSSTARVIPGVW